MFLKTLANLIYSLVSGFITNNSKHGGMGMKSYALRIACILYVICLCYLTVSRAVEPGVHEAIALVSIHPRTGDTDMQKSMIAKEIMLLRTIASTILTNDERLAVQHTKERPEFIIIRVAVDDRGDAVSLCNKIVENFCRPSTGQVFRQLLERAIPRQSVIDVHGNGLPAESQHMFISDLHMEQEALDLHMGGDREGALRMYKRILDKHPHLKHIQTIVDELTRETDPSAYFEMHPDNFDAWLTLFAELIKANAFDEAKKHIEKLPHGENPAIYQRSLELRENNSVKSQ